MIGVLNYNSPYIPYVTDKCPESERLPKPLGQFVLEETKEKQEEFKMPVINYK